MPGLTAILALWCGSYLSHSSGVGGLVPTRLISPFSTLRNWGNSSRLWSLIKFPNPFFTVPSGITLHPIIRGSASILNISPPPTRFLSISSFFRSSASMYMLRNLYILKRFPFLPILSCMKNTGPGDTASITGASTRNRIPVAMHPATPPAISMARFANCCSGVA